jgi:DNA-binding transcriptional regulator GbsR (MarR family)
MALALRTTSSDTTPMSVALRSTFAAESPPLSAHEPLVSDVRSLFPQPLEDRALVELQDRFIEAWGKMATSFAMNRTLGRVHALIYISVEPIDVETVAARLALAPEHCLTLVDELVSWGLVREVEHGGAVARYEAEQDPWSWFMRTVHERYEREFLPLQQSVRQVLELAREVARHKPVFRATVERVERFSRFIDEVMRFVDAFVQLGAKPMATVLKTVAKLMPRGRYR